MTTLHRMVVTWAGAGVVGSAVSVLHWDGSDNPAPNPAAVKSAFSAMAQAFPSGLQITIPNSGDSIDDRTGALVGVWTAAGGGLATVGNQAQNAAGAGAVIGWTTGGIVTGTKGPRKLRGRTFLVPLQAFAYQSDGTIVDSVLADIRTGAQALQDAGPLAIWHRPTTAGGSDGNSYGVISNRVRDKVAFLSSRRD